MTDIELLTAAAKAAGIDGRWDGEHNCFYEFKHAFQNPWNPLTDDGAALRLAVKLLLDVTFSETHVFAFPPGKQDGCFELINAGDPYAATRRAIVRAAAEIGKALTP